MRPTRFRPLNSQPGNPYARYTAQRFIDKRSIKIEALINPQSRFPEPTPLREPTYFILLSLATQPRHGYAIRKDVQFLSDDRISLSASTLYTALKGLFEQGWFAREADQSASSARERKVYRLTELGQSVLEAEVARLETLILAAQHREVRRSSSG